MNEQQAILERLLQLIQTNERIEWLLASRLSAPQETTPSEKESVVLTPEVRVDLSETLVRTSVVNLPLPVKAEQNGTWNVLLANQPITVQTPEEPTFLAFFDRVTPAMNKLLATLWNGSTTHRVRIYAITLWNFQDSTLTTVPIDGELLRITAQSGGVPITPNPMDTTQPLPSGIIATHGGSATTAQLLTRFVASRDSMTSSGEIAQALLSVQGSVIYQHRPPLTPLTLQPNEGITLRQESNTTIGSVSTTILFSVIAV